MKRTKITLKRYIQRKHRTRSKIFGTKLRPRLSIFRSNRDLYVQLIDDERGHTLVGASTRELKDRGRKTHAASTLGKLITERAKQAGIQTVVLDRGAYKYHGRVKALAEAIRGAGLKI